MDHEHVLGFERLLVSGTVLPLAYERLFVRLNVIVHYVLRNKFIINKIPYNTVQPARPFNGKTTARYYSGVVRAIGEHLRIRVERPRQRIFGADVIVN